jgi:hypothetical protein
MKNPNDPIQNRTQNLSRCSGPPQPTAAPHINSTKQQKIRAYDVTTGINQSYNMSFCASKNKKGIIPSHRICTPIFGPQVLHINKVLV